jgi:hypothetical protein
MNHLRLKEESNLACGCSGSWMVLNAYGFAEEKALL